MASGKQLESVPDLFGFAELYDDPSFKTFDTTSKLKASEAPTPTDGERLNKAADLVDQSRRAENEVIVPIVLEKTGVKKYKVLARQKVDDGDEEGGESGSKNLSAAVESDKVTAVAERDSPNSAEQRKENINIKFAKKTEATVIKKNPVVRAEKSQHKLFHEHDVKTNRKKKQSVKETKPNASGEKKTVVRSNEMKTVKSAQKSGIKSTVIEKLAKPDNFPTGSSDSVLETVKIKDSSTKSGNARSKHQIYVESETKVTDNESNSASANIDGDDIKCDKVDPMKCSVKLNRDPSIESIVISEEKPNDELKSVKDRQMTDDSESRDSEGSFESQSSEITRQNSSSDLKKLDMVFDAKNIEVRKSGRLKSAKCASRYRGDYGIRADTYTKLLTQKVGSDKDTSDASVYSDSEISQTVDFKNELDVRSESIKTCDTVSEISNMKGLHTHNKCIGAEETICGTSQLEKSVHTCCQCRDKQSVNSGEHVLPCKFGTVDKSNPLRTSCEKCSECKDKNGQVPFKTSKCDIGTGSYDSALGSAVSVKPGSSRQFDGGTKLKSTVEKGVAHKSTKMPKFQQRGEKFLSDSSDYVHSVGKSVNKKETRVEITKKSIKKEKETLVAPILSQVPSPTKGADVDPIRVLETLRQKLFENAGADIKEANKTPKTFESALIGSRRKRNSAEDRQQWQSVPLGGSGSQSVIDNDTGSVRSGRSTPRCTTPRSEPCGEILEEISQTLETIQKVRQKTTTDKVKVKGKKFKDKKFLLRSMSKDERMETECLESNEPVNEDRDNEPIHSCEKTETTTTDNIPPKEKSMASRSKRGSAESIASEEDCDLIKNMDTSDIKNIGQTKTQEPKKAQSKPKSVICQACNQKFRSKDLLRKHYPCRVRQTRTWSQNKLRPHRAVKRVVDPNPKKFVCHLPKSGKQSGKQRPQLLFCNRKTKFRRVKGKRRRRLYQAIQELMQKRKPVQWPHLSVFYHDLSFKEQNLYRLGLLCAGKRSEGLDQYSANEIDVFETHRTVQLNLMKEAAEFKPIPDADVGEIVPLNFDESLDENKQESEIAPSDSVLDTSELSTLDTTADSASGETGSETTTDHKVVIAEAASKDNSAKLDSKLNEESLQICDNKTQHSLGDVTEISDRIKTNSVETVGYDRTAKEHRPEIKLLDTDVIEQPIDSCLKTLIDTQYKNTLSKANLPSVTREGVTDDNVQFNEGDKETFTTKLDASQDSGLVLELEVNNLLMHVVSIVDQANEMADSVAQVIDNGEMVVTVVHKPDLTDLNAVEKMDVLNNGSKTTEQSFDLKHFGYKNTEENRMCFNDVVEKVCAEIIDEEIVCAVVSELIEIEEQYDSSEDGDPDNWFSYAGHHEQIENYKSAEKEKTCDIETVEINEDLEKEKTSVHESEIEMFEKLETQDMNENMESETVGETEFNKNQSNKVIEENISDNEEEKETKDDTNKEGEIKEHVETKEEYREHFLNVEHSRLATSDHAASVESITITTIEGLKDVMNDSDKTEVQDLQLQPGTSEDTVQVLIKNKAIPVEQADVQEAMEESTKDLETVDIVCETSKSMPSMKASDEVETETCDNLGKSNINADEHALEVEETFTDTRANEILTSDEVLLTNGKQLIEAKSVGSGELLNNGIKCSAIDDLSESTIEAGIDRTLSSNGHDLPPNDDSVTITEAIPLEPLTSEVTPKSAEIDTSSQVYLSTQKPTIILTAETNRTEVESQLPIENLEDHSDSSKEKTESFVNKTEDPPCTTDLATEVDQVADELKAEASQSEVDSCIAAKSETEELKEKENPSNTIDKDSVKPIVQSLVPVDQSEKATNKEPDVLASVALSAEAKEVVEPSKTEGLDEVSVTESTGSADEAIKEATGIEISSPKTDRNVEHATSDEIHFLASAEDKEESSKPYVGISTVEIPEPEFNTKPRTRSESPSYIGSSKDEIAFNSQNINSQNILSDSNEPNDTELQAPSTENSDLAVNVPSDNRFVGAAVPDNVENMETFKPVSLKDIEERLFASLCSSSKPSKTASFSKIRNKPQPKAASNTVNVDIFKPVQKGYVSLQEETIQKVSILKQDENESVPLSKENETKEQLSFKLSRDNIDINVKTKLTGEVEILRETQAKGELEAKILKKEKSKPISTEEVVSNVQRKHQLSAKISKDEEEIKVANKMLKDEGKVKALNKTLKDEAQMKVPNITKDKETAKMPHKVSTDNLHGEVSNVKSSKGKTSKKEEKIEHKLRKEMPLKAHGKEKEKTRKDKGTKTPTKRQKSREITETTPVSKYVYKPIYIDSDVQESPSKKSKQDATGISSEHDTQSIKSEKQIDTSAKVTTFSMNENTATGSLNNVEPSEAVETNPCLTKVEATPSKKAKHISLDEYMKKKGLPHKPRQKNLSTENSVPETTEKEIVSSNVSKISIETPELESVATPKLTHNTGFVPPVIKPKPKPAADVFAKANDVLNEVLGEVSDITDKEELTEGLELYDPEVAYSKYELYDPETDTEGIEEYDPECNYLLDQEENMEDDDEGEEQSSRPKSNQDKAKTSELSVDNSWFASLLEAVGCIHEIVDDQKQVCTEKGIEIPPPSPLRDLKLTDDDVAMFSPAEESCDSDDQQPTNESRAEVIASNFTKSDGKITKLKHVFNKSTSATGNPSEPKGNSEKIETVNKIDDNSSMKSEVVGSKKKPDDFKLEPVKKSEEARNINNSFDSSDTSFSSSQKEPDEFIIKYEMNGLVIRENLLTGDKNLVESGNDSSFDIKTDFNVKKSSPEWPEMSPEKVSTILSSEDNEEQDNKGSSVRKHSGSKEKSHQTHKPLSKGSSEKSPHKSGKVHHCRTDKSNDKLPDKENKPSAVAKNNGHLKPLYDIDAKRNQEAAEVKSTEKFVRSNKIEKLNVSDSQSQLSEIKDIVTETNAEKLDVPGESDALLSDNDNVSQGADDSESIDMEDMIVLDECEASMSDTEEQVTSEIEANQGNIVNDGHKANLENAKELGTAQVQKANKDITPEERKETPVMGADKLNPVTENDILVSKGTKAYMESTEELALVTESENIPPKEPQSSLVDENHQVEGFELTIESADSLTKDPQVILADRKNKASSDILMESDNMVTEKVDKSLHAEEELVTCDISAVSEELISETPEETLQLCESPPVSLIDEKLENVDVIGRVHTQKAKQSVTKMLSPRVVIEKLPEFRVLPSPPVLEKVEITNKCVELFEDASSQESAVSLSSGPPSLEPAESMEVDKAAINTDYPAIKPCSVKLIRTEPEMLCIGIGSPSLKPKQCVAEVKETVKPELAKVNEHGVALIKTKQERHFLDILGCVDDNSENDVDAELASETGRRKKRRTSTPLRDEDPNKDVNENFGRHFSDIMSVEPVEPVSKVQFLMDKSEHGEVTLAQIKQVLKPITRKQKSSVSKDSLVKLRTDIAKLLSQVKPVQKDPAWLKRDALTSYSKKLLESEREVKGYFTSFDDSDESEGEVSEEKRTEEQTNDQDGNVSEKEEVSSKKSIADNIMEMLKTFEDKGSIADNMSNLLDVLAENLGFLGNSKQEALLPSDSESDGEMDYYSNNRPPTHFGLPETVEDSHKAMIANFLQDEDGPPSLDEIPTAEDTDFNDTGNTNESMDNETAQETTIEYGESQSDEEHEQVPDLDTVETEQILESHERREDIARTFGRDALDNVNNNILEFSDDILICNNDAYQEEPSDLTNQHQEDLLIARRVSDAELQDDFEEESIPELVEETIDEEIGQGPADDIEKSYSGVRNTDNNHDIDDRISKIDNNAIGNQDYNGDNTTDNNDESKDIGDESFCYNENEDLVSFNEFGHEIDEHIVEKSNEEREDEKSPVIDSDKKEKPDPEPTKKSKARTIFKSITELNSIETDEESNSSDKFNDMQLNLSELKVTKHSDWNLNLNSDYESDSNFSDNEHNEIIPVVDKPEACGMQMQVIESTCKSKGDNHSELSVPEITKTTPEIDRNDSHMQQQDGSVETARVDITESHPFLEQNSDVSDHHDEDIATETSEPIELKSKNTTLTNKDIELDYEDIEVNNEKTNTPTTGFSPADIPSGTGDASSMKNVTSGKRTRPFTKDNQQHHSVGIRSQEDTNVEQHINEGEIPTNVSSDKHSSETNKTDAEPLLAKLEVDNTVTVETPQFTGWSVSPVSSLVSKQVHKNNVPLAELMFGATGRELVQSVTKAKETIERIDSDNNVRSVVKEEKDEKVKLSSPNTSPEYLPYSTSRQTKGSESIQSVLDLPELENSPQLPVLDNSLDLICDSKNPNSSVAILNDDLPSSQSELNDTTKVIETVLELDNIDNGPSETQAVQSETTVTSIAADVKLSTEGSVETSEVKELERSNEEESESSIRMPGTPEAKPSKEMNKSGDIELKSLNSKETEEAVILESSDLPTIVNTEIDITSSKQDHNSSDDDDDDDDNDDHQDGFDDRDIPQIIVTSESKVNFLANPDNEKDKEHSPQPGKRLGDLAVDSDSRDTFTYGEDLEAHSPGGANRSEERECRPVDLNESSGDSEGRLVVITDTSTVASASNNLLNLSNDDIGKMGTESESSTFDVRKESSGRIRTESEISVVSRLEMHTSESASLITADDYLFCESIAEKVKRKQRERATRPLSYNPWAYLDDIIHPAKKTTARKEVSVFRASILEKRAREKSLPLDDEQECSSRKKRNTSVPLDFVEKEETKTELEPPEKRNGWATDELLNCIKRCSVLLPKLSEETIKRYTRKRHSQDDEEFRPPIKVTIKLNQIVYPPPNSPYASTSVSSDANKSGYESETEESDYETDVEDKSFTDTDFEDKIFGHHTTPCPSEESSLQISNREPIRIKMKSLLTKMNSFENDKGKKSDSDGETSTAYGSFNDTNYDPRSNKSRQSKSREMSEQSSPVTEKSPETKLFQHEKNVIFYLSDSDSQIVKSSKKNATKYEETNAPQYSSDSSESHDSSNNSDQESDTDLDIQRQVENILNREESLSGDDVELADAETAITRVQDFSEEHVKPVLHEDPSKIMKLVKTDLALSESDSDDDVGEAKDDSDKSSKRNRLEQVNRNKSDSYYRGFERDDNDDHSEGDCQELIGGTNVVHASNIKCVREPQQEKSLGSPLVERLTGEKISPEKTVLSKNDRAWEGVLNSDKRDKNVEMLNKESSHVNYTNRESIFSKFDMGTLNLGPNDSTSLSYSTVNISTCSQESSHSNFVSPEELPPSHDPSQKNELNNQNIENELRDINNKQDHSSLHSSDCEIPFTLDAITENVPSNKIYEPVELHENLMENITENNEIHTEHELKQTDEIQESFVTDRTSEFFKNKELENNDAVNSLGLDTFSTHVPAVEENDSDVIYYAVELAENDDDETRAAVVNLESVQVIDGPEVLSEPIIVEEDTTGQLCEVMHTEVVPSQIDSSGNIQDMEQGFDAEIARPLEVGRDVKETVLESAEVLAPPTSHPQVCSATSKYFYGINEDSQSSNEVVVEEELVTDQIPIDNVDILCDQSPSLSSDRNVISDSLLSNPMGTSIDDRFANTNTNLFEDMDFTSTNLIPSNVMCSLSSETSPTNSCNQPFNMDID